MCQGSQFVKTEKCKFSRKIAGVNIIYCSRGCSDVQYRHHVCATSLNGDGMKENSVTAETFCPQLTSKLIQIISIVYMHPFFYLFVDLTLLQ